MNGEQREFYKTICQPQFEDINGKAQTVIDILKGKNGEPGLCEEVRDIYHEVKELKKIHNDKVKKKSWLTKTFIAAVIIQVVLIGKEFIVGFIK